MWEIPRVSSDIYTEWSDLQRRSKYSRFTYLWRIRFFLSSSSWRLAWKGLRREKRGEGPVRPIRRIRGPVERGPAIKQLTGAVADISSINLLEHEGKHNFLLCSLFCFLHFFKFFLFTCFAFSLVSFLIGNPSLRRRLSWTTIFSSSVCVFVSFHPVCCCLSYSRKVT